MRIDIQLTVNGVATSVSVPPMKTLLDVLREELGLTGTKYGCGEGECGACTVVLDGRAVMACLVPVVQAGGCEILTVEGLADKNGLNELQREFLECGGAQCGICTPGMLMTVTAHLQQGGAGSHDAVREAIAGNLCRCTGYSRILESVERAARHRD